MKTFNNIKIYHYTYGNVAVRAMGCSVGGDGLLDKEKEKDRSDTVESFNWTEYDPDKIGMAAEAFANTYGGRIIICTDRLSELDPVPNDTKIRTLMRDLSKISKNNIPFKIYSTSTENVTYIVADIGIAFSRPSDHYGGLIRSGTANLLPSGATRQDLIDEKNVFSDVPTGISPFGKSMDWLPPVIDAINGISGTVHSSSDLGLTYGSADCITYSKDAEIVAGLCDNSAIDCRRIRGAKITDQKTYSGMMFGMISSAVMFVTDHIELSSDGVFEIPIVSIREFLINAVSHRSYNRKEHVTLDIHDDKVEIVSPGMMPFGIRPSDARSGQKLSRHPVISNLFNIAGMSMGLSAAAEECISAGLRSPTVEQIGEDVKVTVYRSRAPESCDSEAILDYLGTHPRASIAETSDHFGRSIAMTRVQIDSLREKGLLKREGSKKYGMWKVTC